MENESMVSTAENVEKEQTSIEEKEGAKATPVVDVPKTYTRDEVNKMLNAERAKEREAVLREVEARKAEAEKLAKMDEVQKKDYELEQFKQRAIDAENKLNAFELKDEAVRQASEKGVDLELMQTLDYTKETAESISKKIEIFARSMRKTHEKAIEEYSKEPTPQVGDHNPTTKSLSDCKSYEDFDNYYKENSKK